MEMWLLQKFPKISKFSKLNSDFQIPKCPNYFEPQIKIVGYIDLKFVCGRLCRFVECGKVWLRSEDFQILPKVLDQNVPQETIPKSATSGEFKVISGIFVLVLVYDWIFIHN